MSGFLFLSCRPLSHTPPLSVLTTFDCVWSNSNLMNLLIFLAWHPDTSQISTSKVAQFVLILKIWPLVKRLIRSDVQRFGLSTPFLCLMNCGIPLLTMTPSPKATSSQIQINSSGIVQMWLGISYDWSGRAADESEKWSEKAPETGSVVNATLRCWQEGGIH